MPDASLLPQPSYGPTGITRPTLSPEDQLAAVRSLQQQLNLGMLSPTDASILAPGTSATAAAVNDPSVNPQAALRASMADRVIGMPGGLPAVPLTPEGRLRMQLQARGQAMGSGQGSPVMGGGLISPPSVMSSPSAMSPLSVIPGVGANPDHPQYGPPAPAAVGGGTPADAAQSFMDKFFNRTAKPERQDSIADAGTYNFQPLPQLQANPAAPQRDLRAEAHRTAIGTAIASVLARLGGAGGNAVPDAISGYASGANAGNQEAANIAQQNYAGKVRDIENANQVGRQGIEDQNAAVSRAYQMAEAKDALHERGFEFDQGSYEKGLESAQRADTMDRLYGSRVDIAKQRAAEDFAKAIPSRLRDLASQGQAAQNAGVKDLNSQAAKYGINFYLPPPGDPTGQTNVVQRPPLEGPPTRDDVHAGVPLGAGIPDPRGSKQFPILNPKLDPTSMDIVQKARADNLDVRTQQAPRANDIRQQTADNLGRATDAKIQLGNTAAAQRDRALDQRDRALAQGDQRVEVSRTRINSSLKDPTLSNDQRRFRVSTQVNALQVERAKLTTPDLAMQTREAMDASGQMRRDRSDRVNGITNMIVAARRIYGEIPNGRPPGGNQAMSIGGGGSAAPLTSAPGASPAPAPAQKPAVHYSNSQPRTGTGLFNGPPTASTPAASTPRPAPTPSFANLTTAQIRALNPAQRRMAVQQIWATAAGKGK